VIRTARLDLIMTTVEHLKVELESPAMLGEILGVEVPVGWPPGFYDQDAMRFFLARALEDGESAKGWYGWYGVLRERPPLGDGVPKHGLLGDGGKGLLVAAGGYFGPPSADGTVEIGYSVVGAVRGRGIATEVASALVERALGTPGVERVVAEAHELNLASWKVLERCGLSRVGPGREPQHVRFERRRQGP